MLVHYTIIRKDLPLGVMAAMLVHAAGESGALYQHPYDGRFRGATAVVLEVGSEEELYKAEKRLRGANIPYVAVVENGGPYSGQLMALGVVPAERSTFGDVLVNYRLLRELDNQSGTTLNS